MFGVENSGGVAVGSATYLNAGDTVGVTIGFNETVGTAPTVQFKNDSTDLGSAVTASSVTLGSATSVYDAVLTGSDSAGHTDPLDFGDVSSVAGLARETLGNGYVYKTTQAFTDLRISAGATFSSGVALRVRYAATKPSTGTVDSHGTLLWNEGSTISNYFANGSGNIASAPTGTYFWIYPSASRTVGTRTLSVVSGSESDFTTNINYDSGSISGTDSGGVADPLDYGDFSSVSGISRETLGNGYVYKTDKAFAAIVIYAEASFNQGVAFQSADRGDEADRVRHE